MTVNFDHDTQYYTPDELAKYGGKWSAVAGKQIVAVAKTLESLHDKLRGKGFTLVSIDYIEDPKYVVVYGVQ